MNILVIYLIIINIFAIFMTVHDKIAAIGGKWRVKERTLLLIAVLGGSPAMLLTMLLIRHKTRKPKFMVGIPLIIVLQLAALYLVLHYGYRLL